MLKKYEYSENSKTVEDLKPMEKKIYDFVVENWPTFPLEIADHFGEPIGNTDEKKKASAKYSYYLKKLIANNLLLQKKAGHSIIVWPLVAEKYRVIHQILGDKHA